MRDWGVGVAVAVQNVTYRTGGAALVERLDLEVSPGELVAIVGPNGAGKSTLLGIMAGDLGPTEGRVLIAGVDAATRRRGELALVRGMLTQRSLFDVPFTAVQVVAMGRFPHRRDPANSSAADAAAVDGAMRRTGTTAFAGRGFDTLSDGERMLVSLARVLAQETPLVLLDEPTASLDIAHQEQILGEAERLAGEGRTVVAALHDLNAAAMHADRIVLMDQGCVRAVGPPRDVLIAAVLSAVYGRPVTVVDHPFRDCPLVLVGLSEGDGDGGAGP